MKYVGCINSLNGKICYGANQLQLPAATGNLVTEDGVQTMINKTLTDSTTVFQDEADNTKKMQLQLSSISTATTRTLTVPDASGTFVLEDLTQTLTNKTLTTPVVSGIYQDAGKTKLMSLPDTASDTLVSLAASQVLTNKTITTPYITSIYMDAGKTKLMTLPDTASDTLVSLAATQTLTNKTLTTPVIASFYQDAGQTNTLTAPAVTDTICGIAATQTLTNKTIGSLKYTVTDLSTDTTLGAHCMVRMTGLSAETKLTLPDCKTSVGKEYIIVREDATYNVVINAAGADTINDGVATSHTMSSNNSNTTIFSPGGTNWQLR